LVVCYNRTTILKQTNQTPKMSSLLNGTDIAKVLSSVGPVVKCVLLKAALSTTSKRKPSCKSTSVDDKDDTKDDRKEPPPSSSLSTDPIDTVLAENEKDKEVKEEQPTREVLLDLIEEIEIDTTPTKNMVAKTLGGAFTFLGQYEDEGIVLIVRRLRPKRRQPRQVENNDSDDDDDEENYEEGDPDLFDRQEMHQQLQTQSLSELRKLCKTRNISMDGLLEKEEVIQALLEVMEKRALANAINPHQLQPPFHRATVRGDILVMKVAEVKEPLDDEDDTEEDDDDDDDNENGDTAEADNGNGAEEADDGDESKEERNNVKDDKAAEPKAAAVNDHEETGDEDHPPQQELPEPPSNDDFFLDYTRAKYIAFASRTDIVEMEDDDDDQEEDDDDEDADEAQDGEEEGESGDDHEEEEAYVPGGDNDEPDDEDKAAMLNLVMNEVLRQYREENGRGPDTRELLEIRSAVAKQLDVEVPEVDAMGADWDQKAPPRIINQIGGNSENITNGRKRNRRIAFTPDTKEEVVATAADDSDEEEADSGEEDDETYEPQAKKRKATPAQDHGEDDNDDGQDRKPAAVEAASSSTVVLPPKERDEEKSDFTASDVPVQESVQ
jgi:hypothetical protein